MLNRYARAAIARVLTPVALLLLRAGVSPDAVTIVGTLGVAVGALAFYPFGHLFWGTVVITCFVFSDAVDGLMARHAGRSSRWGAFLDSTLDRVGDAAVFSGLVLWATGPHPDRLLAVLALACLVLGSLVPYARAKAEGIGARADVGIAERSDRLVVTLVTTGFTGLGLSPIVLTVVLALLAAASVVTVVQRVMLVRRQTLHVDGPGTDQPPAASGGAVRAGL